MKRATVEYIAAGGNRHPSSADWASSLLAFGAGNNIALWNPEDERQAGIYALLAGHTDAVHAIKILDIGSKRFVLSGGADRTIRIWATSDSSPSGFAQTQRLTDHSASVNAITTLSNSNLFASGAADGTVKIWHLEDTTAKLVQTISLKPRYFPLTLALTSLANGDIVLAVGGTSNILQLHVQPASSQEFELQATLTGHEGWIRSLDFTREHDDPQSDILLASASQDKYIRLWRFHQGQSSTAEAHSSLTDDIVAVAEKKSLSNKAHQVGSKGSKYTVTFEALLIGHEDWIYTVHWAPTTENDPIPALLSASADNSLSIWHADPASGLWVCSTRLGEISSQKGSTTATGSTGGFWIGLWQPLSKSVVSLGRTGSWRKWGYDTTSDMWLQQVGIGGHVEEVQSLAWVPSSNYLLSTSSDQTTRLLSEWKRDGKSSWHEFSRPQIHGYDINCLDVITENQFISGADEKLLRVFNKPKAIDNLLAKLAGVASSVADDLPDAANIPVLGLSNKAVVAANDDEQVNGMTDGHIDEQEEVDPASVVHKSPLDLDHPPLEDHLARHTLWPEHEKLYGHGYEISAVCTSNDGSVVATACKSSSIDHAVIRLYDTQEWREVKPSLTAHSLTVTSLAFSKDDNFLLSVGRDRQWAIFEKQADSATSFALLTSNPKGHSRMILDCSWAPSAAGHVFATAGRDKSVKIWRLNENKVECVSTITTGSSVTAVAFHSEIHSETLLLAYGNDEGAVGIVKIEPQSLAAQEKEDFDAAIVPSRTITSLRWRPVPRDRESPSSSEPLQLAVASDDYSLRLYNVV